MLRTLLICGLLAGLIAGIASFGSAKLWGEPALSQAIAYEESHSEPEPAVTTTQADGHTHEHGDEAEVSRGTQSTIGLLTATSVYGLSFGGIFALIFAAMYGRIMQASPRITATWLGFAGFVTIYLVPFIKYPATPPAIGSGDTIGKRTLVYVGMIVISVLAAAIAVKTRTWLKERNPDVATLGGVATYVAIVIAAALVLPVVNEIPADFNPVTLWDFRVGSLATQITMWSVITLVFSYAAQHVMTRDERTAKAPKTAPAAAQPTS